LGSFFFIVVDLFLVHVAGADRTNQDGLASCSQGEDDENAAVLVRSANADKALLFCGMVRIRVDRQLPLEETFDGANGKAMFLALPAIALVPIKLEPPTSMGP
jgi:hypothetical protein